MREREPTEWAVYRAAAAKHGGGSVICSQGEWDEIERSTPGRHTLIRGNIRNEAEAEQLARSLVPPPKPAKPTAASVRRQAERMARIATLSMAEAVALPALKTGE